MAILAYLAVLDWPLTVLIAVFVVLVPLAPRLLARRLEGEHFDERRS